MTEFDEVFQKGTKELREGNLEPATKLLRKAYALTQNPHYKYSIQLLLAEAYSKSGNIAMCIAALGFAEKLSVDSCLGKESYLKVLQLKLECYRKEGNDPRAVEKLKQEIREIKGDLI